MKMFILFLFMLFMMKESQCANKFGDEDAPSKVMKAAQKCLIEDLNSMGSLGRRDFGFNDGDTFEKSTLGAPFKIHYFNFDSLQVAKNKKRVCTLTKIFPKENTNNVHSIWEFPVECNGDSKVLFKVDYNDSTQKCEAIEMGGAEMAKIIGQVRKQWPAQKGYHPIFFQMGSIRTRITRLFFHIPDINDNILTVIQIEGYPDSLQSNLVVGKNPKPEEPNNINRLTAIENHDFSKIDKFEDHFQEIENYRSECLAKLKKLINKKAD